MTTTIKDVYYGTTLVAVECGACGFPFGLPNNYLDMLKSSGERFHCPRGCAISYHENREKELRRLLELEQGVARRRLATIEREREEKETVKRRLAAAKGQQTKLKNRIAKGVCPCCKRSFVALEQHMTKQHPDFTDH